MDEKITIITTPEQLELIPLCCPLFFEDVTYDPANQLVVIPFAIPDFKSPIELKKHLLYTTKVDPYYKAYLIIHHALSFQEVNPLAGGIGLDEIEYDADEKVLKICSPSEFYYEIHVWSLEIHLIETGELTATQKVIYPFSESTLLFGRLNLIAASDKSDAGEATG